MPTIIDALIVTLKLDPTQFKQAAEQAKASQDALNKSLQSGTQSVDASTAKAGGKAKQASAEKKKRDDEERKRRRQREKEEKEAHDAESKRNDESISKLKSLGLAAAGMVLGFNSVKGALEAYMNATSQLAGLGRFGPTVGASVKELDTLGDAYKQVGGKAEDAGSDIARLAHAQFSYAINAPDATAGWLRRLGVNPFDDKGNPRDKLVLQEEIARAIKSRTGDLQTQAMYAREMGMSEAFIQLYLIKDQSARADILGKAEKTARATEAGAKAAARQESSFANMKNHVKAIGEDIVAKVAPGLAIAADAISNTLDGVEKGAAADVRMLGVLGIRQQKFNPVSFKGATPYQAQFAAAEKKYGLPAGLLASIAHRESNFNPNASHVNSHGKVTGQGLMQLNPANFPKAGQSTSSDIDTAASELAKRYKAWQRYVGADTALSLAIADYNDGQKNIGKRLKAGEQAPQETRDYVNAVENYARYSADRSAASVGNVAGSGGGSTTNISTRVDKVEVHTAATDAKGIVAEIGPEMQRQGVVSQANTGMN
jgi:soluble lytic murein transglycosylase-like protein